MTYSDDAKVLDQDTCNALSFLNPTVNRYIFTNMTYSKAFVTFKNNIKIPVNHNTYYGSDKGVYILTELHVPRSSNVIESSLVNFNMANIEDKDISQMINSIYTYSTHDRRVFSEIFIPEDDLASYGEVLVPQYNLLITMGDETTVYPNHVDVEMDLDKFMMVVYDSKNVGKKYYVKVAGVIKELIAKKGNMKDGVYVYTMMYGGKHRVHFGLDELATNGVYTNRYDAISDGRRKENIELNKIIAEITLIHAEIHAKQEILKLGLVKAGAEADIKISIAKQQQELANRKTAIENSSLDRKNIKESMGIFGDILSLAGKII